MENRNQKIKLARYMLLGTVIITVVNLAFLLGDWDMYISYSAAVPYYLVWLGKLFDNGLSLGPLNGQYTATGLVMAGVVLAGYLIVWWLARDSRRWLMVGMWAIVADLVILVVLAVVLFSDPLSVFWEAVLHGAVIWEMSQGLKAYKHSDAPQNQPQEECVL